MVGMSPVIFRGLMSSAGTTYRDNGTTVLDDDFAMSDINAMLRHLNTSCFIDGKWREPPRRNKRIVGAITG
jgi:hypothetical protein